jgi:hypothetical protein
MICGVSSVLVSRFLNMGVTVRLVLKLRSYSHV